MTAPLPSRAITKRRTRRQPYGRGKERRPQLTRTDPSRTVYPRQPRAPAGPERNHRGQAEPAAATKAAEYVAVSHCHTISHNINTVLLQRALNLFNLLLIHTSNANAAVDITITVFNNFELKRDTVQTKNNLPAQ